MGFLDRMSTVVQAKMNKIMDKIEDPREVLDVSYEKQLQLLQNVKRGVAEVTTSKKRIELQKAKLQLLRASGRLESWVTGNPAP